MNRMKRIKGKERDNCKNRKTEGKERERQHERKRKK
jgi:hypothetical protein